MLAPREKLWPAAPLIVTEALDALNVSPADVLLDLGSGDGVALFAAASRGARAVGFEIVAERAAASRAEAISRGFAELVTVHTQNALDAPVEALNVSKVYLYLIARGLRLVLPLLRRAAAVRPSRTIDVATVLYSFDKESAGVELLETRKIKLSEIATTPIFLYRVHAVADP